MLPISAAMSRASSATTTECSQTLRLASLSWRLLDSNSSLTAYSVISVLSWRAPIRTTA
jgi:hypothetical protein